MEIKPLFSSSILKPNGVWINLGPLLYHYSDIMGEHSIEPTFEDICHIMTQVGFVIEVRLSRKFFENKNELFKKLFPEMYNRTSNNVQSKPKIDA